MNCTWEKINGRYVCQAKQCTHWSENGCLLGKISLTCDNNSCKWNRERVPGIYGCMCMDVHLDADGKCLGYEMKKMEESDGKSFGKEVHKGN